MIKGSTIASRTNPFKAMAPACRIGILLNLSISGGLMPTLFCRTIYRRIEGATDRRVQRIALSQIRYSGNKAIELSTFKHLFLTSRKVQIKSVTY
jgi:hypothetical protein